MYGVVHAFRERLRGRLLATKKSKADDPLENLQLSVVFIRPMLTRRHTMAIPFAASRSLSSLSRRTFDVLLLLDIVSM